MILNFILYGIFCVLNYFDYDTTKRLLNDYPGEVYESNPVVAYIINKFGMTTFQVIKLGVIPIIAAFVLNNIIMTIIIVAYAYFVYKNYDNLKFLERNENE
jgi:hypothetical protein